MALVQKPDGFPGQRLIVLPLSAAQGARERGRLSDLFPTDVGWFPQASGHLRSRPQGCPQGILIYCCAGHGFYSGPNGQTGTLGPDEALFIPPQTPHTYGASPEDPWSIYWVHFQGRHARSWSEPGFDSVSIGTRRRTLICQLFEELESTLDKRFDLNDLERGAGILHHLLSVVVYPVAAIEGEVEDRLGAVMQYMADNPSHRATVAELAARAHYSVSHFIAMFGRRTGTAPLEYWQTLRIREACRRLDAGPAGIAEVAESLGYEDPLYFSRVFRRIMGESPRDYSRRVKG